MEKLSAFGILRQALGEMLMYDERRMVIVSTENKLHQTWNRYMTFRFTIFQISQNVTEMSTSNKNNQKYNLQLQEEEEEGGSIWNVASSTYC